MSVRSAAANGRQKALLAHDTQDHLLIDRFTHLALAPAPNGEFCRFACIVAGITRAYRPSTGPSIFFLPFHLYIASTVGHFEHFAHCVYAVHTFESFNGLVLQAHLFPTPDRIFRSSSTVIRNSLTFVYALHPHFGLLFADIPWGILFSLPATLLFTDSLG